LLASFVRTLIDLHVSGEKIRAEVSALLTEANARAAQN